MPVLSKWNYVTVDAELAFLKPSRNLASMVNSKSSRFHNPYRGRIKVMVKPPRKMPDNVTAGAR